MYHAVLTFWLLQAIALAHADVGDVISDTTKATNAHGDSGYWQDDQPDLMILWPEDSDNVVRRYRSPEGHAYRLWVAPDRGSGFPVGLKDKAMFRQFLAHVKANDDKGWCELAETWTWSGAPPAACGVHSYTQTGACVVAQADKPCADLCRPATRTRTLQVDNGACEPDAEPPPVCTVTAWTPSRDTVCAGEDLTQTRAGSDCNTESRTVTGAKHCPPTCAVTAWTPSRATVCAGTTLTQTRTGSDCNTESRTVAGEKNCSATCVPTDWSPRTRKYCKHIMFEQRRRLADCSYETRMTRGNKIGACRGRCNHWKSRRNNKRCDRNEKHCGAGGGVSVKLNGVWRCCSYKNPCALYPQ